MSRRLLTDAALALALVVVTVVPGLVTAQLSIRKPGDTAGHLARANLPTDYAWWLFAALIVVGVLLRQQRPVAALVVTGVGTFGHLSVQTKFQLLALALPLVLYTVAAMARHRRFSLVALALTMALTYVAMLGSRIQHVEEQSLKSGVKQAQERVEPQNRVAPVDKVPVDKVVVPAAPPWVESMVDTGQAVLEMWLLLFAAFAVGDGMRSRRAHLAVVEQRTADLAREERQRAALAVAAERARITRELHDVVAHGMSVIVVQAQGAAAALERRPDRTATALQHVIETGRSSLAEMRRLLTADRTDPAGETQLAPQPGIGAVPALVDQLRSAGMPIDLHIDGNPEVVPAAVDLSGYRIVQEALTNTLKHAGAGAAAQVRLEFGPECLRVEVADDGAGLAEGADGRGNGLRGIAERVAMLGGTLEIGGGDRRGFRLSATLPLTSPVAAAARR
jgi:signal transduction histidine kinase